MQTVQKSLLDVVIKILSNKLISFFKRSQFCFSLNMVIVVEVDVFGYEEASLLVAGKFDSAVTFSFCITFLIVSSTSLTVIAFDI